MELLYLDESQNATFDDDYHSPREMEAKLKRVKILVGETEFKILDVGGGNGRFLDSILDQFPSALGTLIDISHQLISLNHPHPRKTVTIGSVESLDHMFPPESFDIITVNWLLHHLVAPSYRNCADNCRTALMKCQRLLKKDGVVIVAENMFDGFGGSNLPAWIIYMITTIRTPWFLALSRRSFNTAGVGVCFRSSGAWQAVFREAGLRTMYDDQGQVWELTGKRKLLFPLLAIRQVLHRHFYLQVDTQNEERF
jgi:ubiquinone/menaquinone biosynthesis C-methylase UbiE